MLVCSNDFAKGFLWKYVDMTINKAEFNFLKHRTPHNRDFETLFNRFAHVFCDPSDIHNYLFVVSIIEPFLLKSFITFYSTNVQRFGELKTQNDNYRSLGSVTELIEFIGTDDDKFKLLLISLYYYF
jgi:hypothetical protein